MKSTQKEKVFVAFIPILALIAMVITHETCPSFLPSYSGPKSIYNFFFMVGVAVLIVILRLKTVKKVMKI